MSHDSGSPLSCQAATLLERSLKRENESVVNQSSLAFPDGFAKNVVMDWSSFTFHVLPPEERKQLQKERLLLNEDEEAFSVSSQGRKPAKERRFVQPGRMLLAKRDEVIRWLGGGEILPGGFKFYPASASVMGTGRVCWNPERPEMGVHVVLPSSALQRLGVIAGVSALDFLRDALSRGAQFTRIDLAQDTDSVSMDTVVDAYERGLIVTKLQDEQLIDGRKRGKPAGKTLYVGKRSGRRFIRIYDKAAQQKVDGTWVRCEVEFKQEHAQTAVAHLLSGADARELILSSIDFRELDNSEVKRRTPCAWWRSWVEVAKTVSFPVRKVAASVADMMAWTVKFVAPTLSVLCTYMGNTDWLVDEIRRAAARVPDWKWDVLPLPIGSLSAMAGGAV